jgi:inorganic triphosphatase YgiF
MSVARESELELKLELTREELQRVRAHPALGDLAVGEPVRRTLRSIYFDTPDYRLRALGIAFKLRSEGERWLQTVEAARSAACGNTDDLAGDGSMERPEPNLDLIPSRRLRRRIEKAVARSVLEPVFETVVERTTRQLHAADGDLELALEEGVVRAGSLESSLCEAELELKSGSPECLLHTAAQLFATAPLRLATTNPADRGYGLALGRKANGQAIPLRAELPQLAPDHTCSHALALLVQSAAAQIAASREAVLETEDPDAAHQLRIGLRRLRSAVLAFRPLSDTTAARELERHARALARSVGQLRDADVLIEEIYAPVAGTMRHEPGLAGLREALLAHRLGMRDRVRSELRGQQWSLLQLYLALWPRTIEGAGALSSVTVAKFARLALKKRWRKVADSGERLDDLDVIERHAMRKALKTLRYTAEFFASLYPTQATRRFIKQIRSLQEEFGYLNDVVAAERLTTICREACPDNCEAQRAAGFVLGWHNAHAVQGWKDAQKGWRKLNALPRFWA